MLEWIIIAEDVGKKLITFLTERLEGTYSAKQIKRSLESNCCQINGKTERFASIVLKKRDHVCFHEEQIPKSKPITFMSERILFEDEDLLIYNKPSGIACDPSGILKMLDRHFPSLQLVHRLDKETSGILILAKNSPTHDLFLEMFKNKLVKKHYLAIVEGIPTEKKGTIKNYLGKKTFFQGQTVWGAVSNRKGTFAHTDWECQQKGKQIALISCYPYTGRMHQIRVHLSEMGYPILGDAQYASGRAFSHTTSRLLLHAYQVEFEYKGQKLKITAPIPDDFLSCPIKIDLKKTI